MIHFPLPRRLVPPIHFAAMALGAVLLNSPAALARDEPPPAVTEPPAYGEFIVVPLRVHVLTAEDEPDVDCALTDADIERILGKVNGIWHPAGIHFGLESLRREPAENLEAFRAAVAGRGGKEDGPPQPGPFRLIRPRDSRQFDGLHVYYIHRFAVNGIYMGSDFSIVQETSRLREVEGGIDEPLPRVTAHELGHALSLPHRQDRTNLLASGTTGTGLSAAEVEQSREKARVTKGASNVADLRAAADDAAKAGEVDRAKRLYSWLAALPGEEAGEARSRLEALPDSPSSPVPDSAPVP